MGAKKTRQRKEQRRREKKKQASEREKARRAQQSIEDKEKDWITVEEELETSESYEAKAIKELEEEDDHGAASVYATLALTAAVREATSILADIFEEGFGLPSEEEEDGEDGEADAQGDA